jgi:hypothetical protein
VNIEKLSEAKRVVDDLALPLPINRVKLIATAVKHRQRQSISLEHRQEVPPLLLILEQGLQVCMRSAGPVARADFQGRTTVAKNIQAGPG